MHPKDLLSVDDRSKLRAQIMDTDIDYFNKGKI
jgi:hypothetical protein